MLLDRYFETIDKLYAKIRETQRGNVLQAGRLIAKSVQNGACVHIFDTGHIINSELVERGGGLMLYKPFKYSLNVENPVRRAIDPILTPLWRGLPHMRCARPARCPATL